MSMIVARMQKMKAGNLTGIGNHNERKTKNHSNKDIDKSRSHLNYDLVNRVESYKTDIEKFINENKSTQRSIRKDAVLINEWVLTSDKNFFEDLSLEETKDFFLSAKNYFAETFGEKNIRYAKVHLDETTPHMHMGIVPFDKDNKLSAKRVFNRQALRDVQEDLPRYLREKGFDIERGREGSDRKNLTVPEFKEMKKEQKEIERQIDRKKDELLAYTKEKKMNSSIDDIKIENELKKVKVPSGEKFLWHEFPKTIEKSTGNVIISKEDFNKIQEFNDYSKKREGKLLSLLETDFYKENEKLEKENKKLNNKINSLEMDYITLSEDFREQVDINDDLKDHISELKAEIKLIYKTTKEFLKERTDDLKAFKIVFKDLADSISINSKNNSLDSSFKKEYDKENRVKRQRKEPSL